MLVFGYFLFQNSAAKVLLFFDICKKKRVFLRIVKKIYVLYSQYFKWTVVNNYQQLTNNFF